MRTNSSILKMLCSKTAMIVILAAIAAGAFATSGDGRSRDTNPRDRSILVMKPSYRPGSFSLNPGYSFRGSKVINNQENKYINLSNTTVSYQTGHTTYTVSLKKGVLNDKVVFNPNATTRR
jgi:hypothetical protein